MAQARAEPDEITPAQLAVNAQVEQRKVARTDLHLEADPYRPDVLNLQRRLLPDELSLIPRPATNHSDGRVHFVLLVD